MLTEVRPFAIVSVWTGSQKLLRRQESGETDYVHVVIEAYTTLPSQVLHSLIRVGPEDLQTEILHHVSVNMCTIS
jgi:hypothetical protein